MSKQNAAEDTPIVYLLPRVTRKAGKLFAGVEILQFVVFGGKLPHDYWMIARMLSNRVTKDSSGGRTKNALWNSSSSSRASGARWSFASEKSNLVINGVSKFEGYGEVTEFDPPRVLAYSWIANWHLNKRRASTVRWELTRTANGTEVKVTHSGLVHEDVARADYAGGWIGVVEQLRKFLE